VCVCVCGSIRLIVIVALKLTEWRIGWVASWGFLFFHDSNSPVDRTTSEAPT